MSGNRDWAETKAILDDPNVDHETKQLLLRSYRDHVVYNPDAVNVCYANESEELAQYLDEYDVKGIAFGHYANDLDPIMEEARAQRDDRGWQEQQAREAIDEGQRDLDRITPPGQAGGVDTSDEVLDPGEAGLRFFDTFGQLLAQCPADTIPYSLPGGNPYPEILERYREQNGIQFGKMREDAERLSASQAAVDDALSTVDRKLETLFGTWDGEAADTARQHHADKIKPNGVELSEALGGGAELLTTSMDTVHGLVVDKAQYALDSHTDTMGAASPWMAGNVIAIAAKATSDISEDEARVIAGWLDQETGSNVSSYIDGGIFCRWDDEAREYTQRECRRWIRESFTAEYETLYSSFLEYCDTVRDSVDDSWRALTDYLADFENPFQDVEAMPFTPDGFPGGDGTPGDPGGMPGGMPPGGMPGGGGGSEGGGMPPIPEMPGGGGSPPDMPEMPEPPEMPEIPEVPEDPLGLEDGAPDPEDPLGFGGGIYPEPVEVTPEEPGGRVTLPEPNEGLSLQPGEDGTVHLEVEGEDGQSTEYVVDFGDDGTPQLTPLPAELGDEGRPEVENQPYGPGGPGTTPPGQPIPLRPGPDGVATIEHGGGTVTVERVEGEDGRFDVTVVGPDGSRESYAVHFDPSSSDGGAGGGAAGTSLPGAPSRPGPGEGGDGFRTMPAEAEFRTPGEPGEGMRTMPAEGGLRAPTAETLPASAPGFGGAGQWTSPDSAPAAAAPWGPADQGHTGVGTGAVPGAPPAGGFVGGPTPGGPPPSFGGVPGHDPSIGNHPTPGAPPGGGWGQEPGRFGGGPAPAGGGWEPGSPGGGSGPGAVSPAGAGGGSAPGGWGPGQYGPPGGGYGPQEGFGPGSGPGGPGAPAGGPPSVSPQGLMGGMSGGPAGGPDGPFAFGPGSDGGHGSWGAQPHQAGNQPWQGPGSDSWQHGQGDQYRGGLPNTSTPQASGPAGAGFAAMPDGGQPGQAGQTGQQGAGQFGPQGQPGYGQQAHAAGPFGPAGQGGGGAGGQGGGMGMMGGGMMGGGGQGGQGGQDQERGPSQWRVQHQDVFDANEAAEKASRMRSLFDGEDKR
ncbi:WXG100 family type VII secretion target [Actinoalloteichus caeruleus]|uniref:WXG100 family type VII secretion target n=1 Tax=Actinoalloteichus cyanogriseus TaxID=2893586 RepID=UPI0004AB9A37|nr:WXG100 family type VII secretion target [Actinoalloteichus caeruleus]